MAQWVSFTVFVGVLTVSLLVLARHSQQLLETAAESGTDDRDAIKSTEVRGTDRTNEGGRAKVEVHERFTEAPSTVPERITEIVPEADSLADGHQPEETLSPGELDSLAPPDDESPASEIELTPRALLANVAVTQGLVIVLVLGGIWYFSIPHEALGITGTAMSTGLPAILAGIGFGVVLWIGNELSTTVADVVGAAYDESVRELLAPDSPGGWIVLFGVVLPIIAVAEELLFRAALIGVPAAGFDISPWLLALVSSLAFALGHGAQGTVGIVVTGVLGFVLAAAFILTGSLLLVVVAHYVINALEFFLHEYVGIEGLVEGLIGKTPLS